MTQIVSLSLNVVGRVQGVGFRAMTQRKATELGLVGFVQNLPDGSVMIEAEGPVEQLSELIQWCRRNPGWSRVSDVSITEIPVIGYLQFEIKHGR
ncbi:MAG: acylphosphatase [Bacteroidetes bacterium]|nr:acylphosphatase [Bacteroidales bacterium]MBU1010002.1 acylphosphatase [Bacteroidota bacterium]